MKWDLLQGESWTETTRRGLRGLSDLTTPFSVDVPTMIVYFLFVTVLSWALSVHVAFSFLDYFSARKRFNGLERVSLCPQIRVSFAERS